ncbi:trans-sulfuration enzyme family protein [Chitinophaga niabensis]|uniref:Methionine-gamma-lyase n=1 Tax=Chitinophaga niabensis TaxID=536979 RepID=A0A1N6HE36_9BACT|nr:aminotransferase class I/II-fold pyridoxal phosphate-dependent enzyme [Chitinophaga niabensis]SIO18030.1 methionine-gamma-lyase [Chitinophaga niabensis]
MKQAPLTGFSSVCVHAGHEQDPQYAHLTPIYASSTYVYDSAEQGMHRFSGKEDGYIYTRWDSPNFREAEEKIAALEGFGLSLPLKAKLHASGMGALSTLFFSNLTAGDKVISHYSLYGGTDEMLRKTLPPLGIETIFIDMQDLNKTEEIIKADPSIKMMYLETPANPTLKCVDLEALCGLAQQYKLISAVDNTFATPYLQQPFAYGTDYVFHSTTKFLNGHGTAIGGVLVGKDIEMMRGPVEKMARMLGANSNPFDSFLLTQGIKTLEVRMERHCHNAMEVAGFLDGHPAVARVNYLGLADHPDFMIASRQMKHAGAMLSFELKDGLEAGKRFIDRLQMCLRAVSLGTCDTLICHPASMTHYSVPKELREKYDITDGLIRVSVGIESVTDILNDIEQALA